MSAEGPTYTVGHGKPPLHTRFQKGRSGNPGGRPGPARLARQRFEQALYAALDAGMGDLKDARPRANLDIMVKRLTLDAAAGSQGAMKLILRELDKGIACEESELAPEPGEAKDAVEEDRGAGANEPPPVPDYARWRKANPDG